MKSQGRTRKKQLLLAAVSLQMAVLLLTGCSTWQAASDASASAAETTTISVVSAPETDGEASADGSAEETEAVPESSETEAVQETRSLQGLSVSILGDSYSTYEGYIPEGNDFRYPDPKHGLVITVEETWWMRLLDEIDGELLYNNSWRTTRVSWDGETEEGYLGKDACISSMARVSSLGDNGTPDLILVYAGTNDAFHDVELGEYQRYDTALETEDDYAQLPSQTFADAYQTMILRLRYFYPDSQLFCILPGYVSYFYTPEELDQYDGMMMQICDDYGIPYADQRENGITAENEDEYFPDQMHPNAEGMELIEQVILNRLREVYPE